jgi:hypothetical protein
MRKMADLEKVTKEGMVETCPLARKSAEFYYQDWYLHFVGKYDEARELFSQHEGF